MNILGGLRGQVNSYFDKWEPIEIASGVLAGVVVFKGIKYLVFNYDEAKQNVIKATFGMLKSLPGVDAKIQQEKKKYKDSMTKELSHAAKDQEKFLAIPVDGIDHEEIIRRMTELRDHELQYWKSGKVSGAIYGNDDKHIDLMNKAYSLFSISNPLHPDLFPSIRKYEAEVVKMTSKMLRGDDNVCGALTSGGTESIIMAVKAYRDTNPHIKNPEIIVPVTAHAAFDKAASYLKIKLVHIHMDKEGKVDVGAVRRAITKNTIMICGSAPNFPHGVIDPIEELASIAQEHGIGFHTDACLGGYFLPWVREYSNGKIPNFDFAVPGVTSMSCDTHKYGYATKGTSVVLFRNEELRHGMYFVATDWPGGIYASPSIAGSRPGGLIACCWASLVAMGQSGFETKAKSIYDTVQHIKKGLASIAHVRLMFDTYSNVIAFTSDDLDVFKIAAAMKTKGWNLNNLQKPSCVHLCVTAMHIGMGDVFLQDLAEAVDIVLKNPSSFKDGSAAIYGLAASFPDRSAIRDIALVYLDSVLSA